MEPLARGSDGKLFQVGIADGSPICGSKRSFMRTLSANRKHASTPAEKKLCLALQVLRWKLGFIFRFQRERTVHLADMLSRSLDFYFSQGKLGIEADGGYHRSEQQAAKDEWTDKLMAEHGNILVLRFTNERILGQPHAVSAEIAAKLKQRHNWPRTICGRFDEFIVQCDSAESWNRMVGEMLMARRAKP
jgi:very-short-patch-repair endonuclease